MKPFRLSGNNSHSIGDTGSDLGQENLSICRKIGPCISKNRLKYYEYFQFCQPSNKLSFKLKFFKLFCIRSNLGNILSNNHHMKIIQCLPKAYYNSRLRKYEFPSKNDFQIFIFCISHLFWKRSK